MWSNFIPSVPLRYDEYNNIQGGFVSRKTPFKLCKTTLCDYQFSLSGKITFLSSHAEIQDLTDIPELITARYIAIL
jgi:hypothetical protein